MSPLERRITSLCDGLVQLALPVIKASSIPGFIARGQSMVHRASGRREQTPTLIVVVIGEPALQDAIEALVGAWKRGQAS